MFAWDLFNYSDLLKTIVKALYSETFRNGIIIHPRFVMKCSNCDAEYQQGVTECDRCKTDKFLRPPNLAEKKFMQDWMKHVNFNGDSLQDICQQLDIDLNLIDNTYPAILKEYSFDNNGNVQIANVVELVRASPERVELIMDKNGRFGRSDDGRLVMFCLQHRENFMLVRDEDASAARCNKPNCNLLLYPAFYRARRPRYGPVGGGMDAIYYTDGEIFHCKKFSYNIGYGVPPIWNVWQKLLILLKQDWFILMSYDIQRPPKGILVMRGNREGLDKSWRRVEEEAKVNPHMIYPFIVEAKDVGKVVEWIDLTIKPADVDFTMYREETRRTVGALYGVMPIFAGEQSGQGLSNEGLQVVVTNRAVKAEQTIFNDKILPWICKQLGMRDWVFQCNPSEGRDVVSKIQREQMRINNAMAMQSLGYRAQAVMGEDGIDFVYYEMTGEDLLSITDLKDTTRRLASGRDMQNYEGQSDQSKTSEDMEGGEKEPKNPKVEGSEQRGQAGGSESRTPANAINASLTPETLWFTTADSSDIEIFKSAFNPITNIMLFRGTEAMSEVLNMPNFWAKYDKVSKVSSGKINASIWTNLINGVFEKERYIQDAISVSGLPRDKAELIVSTELANTANLIKEHAYKKGGKESDRFKWLTNNAMPCGKCQNMVSKTATGVSLSELRDLVKTLGGDSARELLPHPNCRCTFRPQS